MAVVHGLRVAFDLVFRDATLGTYEDAAAYLRKAQEANARHLYI